MLPFSYATRNLLRDPSRLLQTVGGSFIVVFLIFAAGSFNQGMSGVLESTGSPLNVILMGAGFRGKCRTQRSFNSGRDSGDCGDSRDQFSTRGAGSIRGGSLHGAHRRS